MIIFGFLTGASISRLFAAGILPGILIGLSLIISSVISYKKGYGAASAFSLKEVTLIFRRAILAIGAPLIILDGILFGIFTATESAAVVVVYALFVGTVIYKKIKFNNFIHLFIEGAVTSSIVIFIIANASIFSWIVAIEDIPGAIAGTLLTMTQNPVLLLLIINGILLIDGTFVETTAALIFFVPMIIAMLPSLNIDIIQLRVIVVTNPAIGMLTPPMGICLIVFSFISKDTFAAVNRRVLPFLGILIIDLLIITFYSPITMWLANLGNVIAVYKVPKCKSITGIIAKTSQKSSYYFVKTDKDPVLFELDENMKGAVILNFWKDKNGPNFLTYIKSSHAWHYMIPDNTSRPALRKIFYKGSYRVGNINGVYKVIKGKPAFICRMIPQ